MFRSVVVVPYKGKEAECWNHNEALIYLGPFSKVTDARWKHLPVLRTRHRLRQVLRDLFEGTVR